MCCAHVPLGEGRQPCQGRLKNTPCGLLRGHVGAHSDPTGQLKWFNKDRPRSEQGFLCKETLPNWSEAAHKQALEDNA